MEERDQQLMWEETIQHVVDSPNLTIILVFLCFVIITFIILSKSGFIDIHTKAVSIGAIDREQQIKMQQCDWIQMHLEGLENTMRKPEGYDAWRGKYVVERVYDEYIFWIMQNHINTSDEYIEIKQGRIIDLVHGLTDKDFFHSEDFDDLLREDTKQCIKKLVRIREYYKGGTI